MPLTHQLSDYRIEDIYALPEGTRAELIDGQIFYIAPPARKHQRLTAELCTVINNYIKSKKGSCEVNIAPFAVFLNADDKNYVEPDISVICDPDKDRIMIYNFESEKTEDYTFQDSVKAGIYEDLIIDFRLLDI